MRLAIEEILRAVSGRTLVPADDKNAVVEGVTWDSRNVVPGCLYVALAGERVDGHAFVADAVRAGAACALVTEDPGDDAARAAREAGAAVIAVADARAALADLAGLWRGKLSGRVIGLTGSSGKTTTKNLVRDVLAHGFSVTATSGNQNNELGVPNTLLSASSDDDAVVVEMGMRGQGQIEALCDFVRPEWGLVVNVGTSHMELLGSRDNIARAKAELLESLPEGGWAFLNGADDYGAFMRESARLDERGVRVAVFDGSSEAGSCARATLAGGRDGYVARPGDALTWAENIELDEEGRARFMLCSAGFGGDGVDAAPCALSLRGLHNVGNACSAAAVGCAMGMPLAAVAEALSKAQAESGRAQVLRTSRGVTVVDDSYNANPDSMRASLRTFSAMRVPGRKIAVLGDMGELGPFSKEGHRRVGIDAARAGVDILACVGPLARDIARSACQAGVPSERISCVDDAAAALALIAPLVATGDAVLVKASHSVGLERVVEGLVD